MGDSHALAAEHGLTAKHDGTCVLSAYTPIYALYMEQD